MQRVLLTLVALIHVLFIIFIVITPFTNSNYLLLMHSVMIPFMIFHWILNDNTCVLTMIERNLKKSMYKDNYNEENCFTCRLIEPVYNFVDDNKKFSTIIYVCVILLWMVSTGKLLNKYRSGEINSWRKLFDV